MKRPWLVLGYSITAVSLNNIIRSLQSSTFAIVVAAAEQPEALVNEYVRVYVPTAVTAGIKLKPDTPMPLQLPPTGLPDKAIGWSLKHILFGKEVTVTVGDALTVSVATLE